MDRTDLERPRLLYPLTRLEGEDVDATIGITTKDRREELVLAVRSAQEQLRCNCEVVVVDDGSSDGSADYVHAAFPGVAVYRSEVSRGWAAQRSFIATVARGRIIISIDDDAELIDPLTVCQTLGDFDAGDDIGAVAIPYRELTANGTWKEVQEPARGEVEIVDAFIGTAYAIRRDLFISLGGFWEYSRNEERDLCVRMLQAGYLVRRGSASHLLHRPSFIRSWTNEAFTGRRNDVLFAYRHVPSADLPWHLARTTANMIYAAMVVGHGRYALPMAKGYAAGLRAFPGTLRVPLQRDVYRLHLRLRRRGPIPVGVVRAALGPTA